MQWHQGRGGAVRALFICWAALLRISLCICIPLYGASPCQEVRPLAISGSDRETVFVFTFVFNTIRDKEIWRSISTSRQIMGLLRFYL